MPCPLERPPLQVGDEVRDLTRRTIPAMSFCTAVLPTFVAEVEEVSRLFVLRDGRGCDPLVE